MKKKWLRALIISGIVILSILMAGMITGIVFGSKIKTIVVSELNRRLATEVKVNGDITFSVFSNFPYASITFNNIQIKETLPEKHDLLTCEKISLLFNIWDVFGSHYTMKKVLVQNGQFLLRVTDEGKTNFDIFRETDASATNSFSLKIEEADLSNIGIVYDDDRTNHHYVFNTETSELSGDFSSNNFLLNIKSDLLCKQLVMGDIDYLPGRRAQVDCQLQVDLNKNLYTFTDSKISIEDNLFLISGNVLSLDEGNQLDLNIAGDDLRIEKIAALLPSAYAGYFSHFSSNGNFQFSGTIKGLVSSSTIPSVNLQFGVKDGTLSHDQLKESFEHLNLSGVYSNGFFYNLSSSYVELKNFSTSFDGNPVSGTLLVRNFNTPYLDMKLDGEVSLKKIAPLFPSDYIRELDGSVMFRQFYFRGSANQFTASHDLNKLEAGGSFTLKDVSIVTNKTTYDKLNGAFDISNNQIIINQLAFNAKGSDLHFEGTVTNFIPYLLSSIEDSTKNYQKIGLNVKLTSNNLSWVDLVGSSEAASSTSSSSEDYYSIPALFYRMTGSVSGRIEKFSYEKFNASALHGNILFLGNFIYFNDFGLNAEKGSATANGKLDITNVKRNRLDLTAKLDHLDINQLFYEVNNFDQHTLTDKNLKGTITSDVALQATWDERKFNNDKLYAVADVIVENGELNNFEPMMALAKFVKLSELKNIRFSKLQNQIEIKNQKVFIPTMQIFTNALNVQLSGTHSFDNTIDYQVQLNLLKLLTAKFEKTSFDPDGGDKSTEGFLNLYLTMTGPASNPVIKYDKRAVKQKIASDLKNEKNELKDVLKKEFDNEEHDKQEIKDGKAPADIQYMEFENDTILAKDEQGAGEESVTEQNQKKEFNNFKSIFKPKSPPK